MIGLINKFIYLFILTNSFLFSEIVHLKGQIKCLEKGLPNITIELYEEDLFDPDDLLATTISDSEGFYEIKGEQNELLGRIEPYLNIKHKCQFKDIKNKHCEYIHKLPILFEVKDDLIESKDYNIDFGELEIKPYSEECNEEINKEENINLTRKERTDEASEEEEVEVEKQLNNNIINNSSIYYSSSSSLITTTTTTELTTIFKQNEENEINNNKTNKEKQELTSPIPY